MRKEVVNTYSSREDGSVVVRGFSPEEEMASHLIQAKDLTLDVDYTDRQGTQKTGRVILKPVVSEAIRLDNILPTNVHLCYLAALNCYSGMETNDLIRRVMDASREEAMTFLSEIVANKHLSVIEHHGPSFIISYISRACSHQLVRHRLLSVSQQSQRYVDFASVRRMRQEMVIPFVMPPRMRIDPRLLGKFLEGMKSAISGYYALRAGGAFPEDARFLLPNAAATRMVVSGNNRVWLELIPKRTCARAQWEADMVVTEIAKQLWEDMPGIFGKVGPACSVGKCDQGRGGCGRPLGKPLAAFFKSTSYPHDQLIFGMR